MTTADLLAEFNFETAVVLTDPDAVLARHGDVDEIHGFASVTKLFSAVATLVAIERGHVGLEDPVGPEGATLRHLLAHASGVPFDKGSTIGRVGARRVYSNYGIELAAAHVEAGTGQDFATWLENTVLVPLGLSTIVLEGSPAHGASGSTEDLAAFGRELLRPTLVGPDLWGEAISVQFPGLSGILPGYGRQKTNDWGLGLEIRDHKDPHWTGSRNSPETFGHFGQSGSFLWVDPARDLACAFLGAQNFGEEHARVWPALSDALLVEQADRVPTRP